MQNNRILGDNSAKSWLFTHTSPRSNSNNLTGVIWPVKGFKVKICLDEGPTKACAD